MAGQVRDSCLASYTTGAGRRVVRRTAMGQGPYFELVPVCVAVIAVCWVLSVVTREYSWVDRIWSIAPPAYLWAMAFRLGFSDARLNLMTGLATLWGARLTYNFARKGGYRPGGEDYRWAVLRERMGPVWFQVFNATFIAPYQNVLLFLMVAPAQVAVQAGTPLGVFDVGLAALFLGALSLETVADQQQWRFHEAKAARRQRGEDGPRF
jgi:steroid 5-alpha reductase family enzyme